MLWMIGALVLCAQESKIENEVLTAAQVTTARGFTYVIKPLARIPEGFPRERAALAGVEVRGKYHDGVYQASDGKYEIVRKGDRVAARTARGWLLIDPFTAPLRQEVAQAFDPNDGRLWNRGNVTAGRKALEDLIQIAHLVQRADVGKLTSLGRAFTDLRKSGSVTIDGTPAAFYEGELTDQAAFEVLQGPFELLVRRGTLAFRNVSGVGRVYLQDGVVRRVVMKAAAAYGYYEDDENIRRKGICSLEILADITKVGETRIDLPKEAARSLEE